MFILTRMMVNVHGLLKLKFYRVKQGVILFEIYFYDLTALSKNLSIVSL